MSRISGFLCVESSHKLGHLIRVCGFELDLHVNAPRTNQGRIEKLDMIRRQEEQAALLGGHTVDGVQEAGESHRPLSASGPLPVVEGGVDVLQQQNAPRGGVRHQLAEHLVRQHAGGEVDDVDAKPQAGGERCDKRGLAGAWRSVEEVAAAVGDAVAGIPPLLLEEALAVRQHMLRAPRWQHHR
eukprot:CAMPEP_0118946784 /NCGR_PEP_ID=MMETSP1169-20130426/44838_1 /TAXON_ID=36882 /ORGANISM="Pyramimonas obovata, Strain CCMP722" /LENGTH=183 /DNA_ID=CAMNT_0006892839 /DNA_START=119 /DNA_END=667 /DNA_ORIENTATION=+